MTAITTAIRADAATSDAEGRAQAAEMVTALTIGALAETVTRLNASEDRALRMEVQRDELLAQIERIDDMLPSSPSRTMSLADNVRAAIAEAASRDSLAADLNATREKLTAAEAFRDSLQAEADGLRAELTTASLLCDAAHAERNQAVEASNALRAEVDKLRARPVLTEAALSLAITSKRTGEEGPRIGTPATIYAQLTEGGAVTLPAQDRAEELLDAIEGRVDRIASAKYKERIAIIASALASLGATATTPSKPADVATVESVARAIWCAYNNAEATGWSNMTVGVRAMWMAAARAAIAARAPVPADVFAGVSIDELADAAHEAVKPGVRQGAGEPWETWCEMMAQAVLDALRVKLVAPVDPLDVARDYHDHGDAPVSSFSTISDDRQSIMAARAMRATLTAKGIPVTPEAGK